MADAKALKRTRFTDVFNTIRDEVLEYVKAQNVPADALEWFKKVRVVFCCVTSSMCSRRLMTGGGARM